MNSLEDLADYTAEAPELITFDDITEERPLTNDDVARLMHDQIGDDHKWCANLGWLRWTGKVWQEVEDEEIRVSALDWIREILDDATKYAVDRGRKHPAKQWLKYLNKATVDAAIDIMKGISPIDIGQLDRDAYLLNAENGTVNLKTGELQPHDRDDFITKMVAAEYHRDATDEGFNKLLSAVDPDIDEWFQVVFGQAVTGTNGQIAPLLRGTGSNGKSLLLQSIYQVAGDYYIQLDDKVIVGDVQNTDPHKARLHGVRLAVIEELPAKMISPKAIKDLTRTPRMSGKHLYKKPFDFATTHTLFLSSNYDLTVPDTDEGTWSRLAWVEFPFSYMDDPDPDQPSERPKDYGLASRVDGGGDAQLNAAVLAWLVEGAVKYDADHSQVTRLPAKVKADTEKWRGDCDAMLRFWNEHLEPDDESVISLTELFDVYRDWCGRNNQYALNSKNFKGQFSQHKTARKAGVKESVVKLGPKMQLSTLAITSKAATVRGWRGVRFSEEFKESSSSGVDSSKFGYR